MALKDRDVSATFIARCRTIRQGRRWTAAEWAAAVTGAGYPLTHQMVRNQEVRPGASISLEQAAAVARATGLTLDAILNGPSCFVCNDAPLPRSRCLECGRANRGA